MKYLFGPVPSRRLGISLGVDLVPHKVCSLDCIYCEVGRTTNLTVERKEYVPVDEVIGELGNYLSQKPKLDFITFSGQGEPTLNIGLGKVLNYIKDNFPSYKVAILTNGTLFSDASLRAEVLRADVILPDLDAVSDTVFKKINRPHKSLNNSKIIEGLQSLRTEFSGKIFVEVFLIEAVNDTQSELKKIKRALLSIAPDLVQLNSLDRPSTEDWVKKMPEQRLMEIADFFKPLETEIVANPQTRTHIQSFSGDIETRILETIRRRPCTDTDLCSILGLHINELNKYLGTMITAGTIESIHMERGVFFKLKQ
ncbi:MAG: radical SAM protein [Candidatus Cloacimonetes bacterium]|jgi:wyosine [tRNA(Phe)-imidazoG37] synthetase (radical SAM superfamily)|nr:radical SAM protein [Candidatus Cloacimonadota bacterium]MCK9333526.1 radical SAM protein [Candidatus Cloacimonadota bacterium]MDD2211073.1 radical SAM protein [Candidatus Cloacimonadota bacterium]MDD4687701.1 radical SAM protein [Candidatus Cloacimonadota bacterium]MDY0299627.1 radical SAM protein [Candidatus Cloacimonadaceae bacterium]